MKNMYFICVMVMTIVGDCYALKEFEKVNWLFGGEILQYYQSSDSKRVIAVGGHGGIYEYVNNTGKWKRATAHQIEGAVRNVVPLTIDTVFVLTDILTMHYGGNMRTISIPEYVDDFTVYNGEIYILCYNYKSYRIDIRSGVVAELLSTPETMSSIGNKIGIGGNDVYLLGWDAVYILSKESNAWEKGTVDPIFMGATNIGVTKIFSVENGIVAASGDAVVLYTKGNVKCDTIFTTEISALYSYSVANDTVYVAEKQRGVGTLHAISISTRDSREINYSSSGALDVVLVANSDNMIIILEGWQRNYASSDGGATWIVIDSGIEEVYISKLAISGETITVVGVGEMLTGTRYIPICRKLISNVVPDCAMILGEDTVLFVDRDAYKLLWICGDAFYINNFSGTKAVATPAGEVFKISGDALTLVSRVGENTLVLRSGGIQNIGRIVGSDGAIFLDESGSIYRYSQLDGEIYISSMSKAGTVTDYMVGIEGDVYYCDDEFVAIYSEKSDKWVNAGVPDGSKILKIVAGSDGKRYMYTSGNNLYVIQDDQFIKIDLPISGEIVDLIVSKRYLYLAFKSMGLYAMEFSTASVGSSASISHHEVYPNPAQNIVNIRVTEENDYDIRLYELQKGTLVLSLGAKPIQGLLSIDLGNISSGAYMLVASPHDKSNMTIERKIVINNRY